MATLNRPKRSSLEQSHLRFSIWNLKRLFYIYYRARSLSIRETEKRRRDVESNARGEWLSSRSVFSSFFFNFDFFLYLLSLFRSHAPSRSSGATFFAPGRSLIVRNKKIRKREKRKHTENKREEETAGGRAFPRLRPRTFVVKACASKLTTPRQRDAPTLSAATPLGALVVYCWICTPLYLVLIIHMYRLNIHTRAHNNTHIITRTYLHTCAHISAKHIHTSNTCVCHVQWTCLCVTRNIVAAYQTISLSLRVNTAASPFVITAVDVVIIVVVIAVLSHLFPRTFCFYCRLYHLDRPTRSRARDRKSVV